MRITVKPRYKNNKLVLDPPRLSRKSLALPVDDEILPSLYQSTTGRLPPPDSVPHLSFYLQQLRPAFLLQSALFLLDGLRTR